MQTKLKKELPVTANMTQKVIKTMTQEVTTSVSIDKWYERCDKRIRLNDGYNHTESIDRPRMVNFINPGGGIRCVAEGLYSWVTRKGYMRDSL